MTPTELECRVIHSSWRWPTLRARPLGERMEPQSKELLLQMLETEVGGVEKGVKTAIGAARAAQARDQVLR